MKAPCKDCENRHPNCHAHCGEYQAFHAENARRLEAQHKANDVFAYRHESRMAAIKRMRWRRK